jgi:dTDP-4-dehydrorhamnose reductase
MSNTNNTKVLLTGATGLLGGHLAGVLSTRFDCVQVGFAQAAGRPGIHRCNLTNALAVETLCHEIAPDIVIHAAALTDVDQCEREPALAHQVNVLTTRHLLNGLQKGSPDACFVYISTDQVYDGPGHNREDQVAPANVYGLTKLWAEDIVRGFANHLVLRTNFFAPAKENRPGFAGWLINSLALGKPITLFTDVYFNPIYVDDLANTLVALLDYGARGTFNLGAANSMSKADFASQLASLFGLSLAQARRTSVAEVVFDAYRPRNMCMSTAKLTTLLDRKIPSIEDGLMKLLAASRPQDIGRP